MAQQKSLDEVQAMVSAMQPMLDETIRKAVRDALADRIALEAVREALADSAAGPRRGRRPPSPRRSPEEWAALRRGEAAALAAHIGTLPSEMNDETFAFYAEPVVSRLREAIQRLGEAESIEGNTLMILDQLLETFLNDERGRVYRDEQARSTVTDILKTLAAAEKVTPEDARSSYSALKRAGLNPAAPLRLDAWAK